MEENIKENIKENILVFLNKKRKYLILFGFFLFLAICFNQSILRVKSYEIKTSKIKNEIRIVHITDLHNKEFGFENKRLIKKIKEQNPDIIVMTGDMILRDTTDYSVILNLVKKLSDVAPCFYSIGNHEQDNMYLVENKELLEQIEQLGGYVLEMGYNMDGCCRDILVKDTTVRIGGKAAYYFENHEKTEEEFFRRLNDTEDYSILLSHFPEVNFENGDLKSGIADLILCGHTHGGLARIPFVGGLYAPGQGLFPEYDYGRYSNGSTELIISSGLGISSEVPRFNNPPEIVLIDLLPL